MVLEASTVHVSIVLYAVFVLGTIYRSRVNLKQFSHVVLICVEINWLCSGFAIVVLGCRVTCASDNSHFNINR